VTEPHHEPSYYEIALTNRQVVVAFVILLACLLAAFFSGVWIGRGGIDPHRDQMVRVTPPPPSPEGRNLEELKFFADRPNKKAGKSTEKPVDKPEEKPAEVAAAANPTPAPDAGAAGTTLQQDLEPPARSAPPARSPRTPRPAPAPPVVRSTPPAPVHEEPAEEPARPESVQTRPVEKASSPQPGSGSAGGPGSVVIQVFASADQAEAGRVRDRLSKGGQAAFLSPLTVEGRTMYRVRIGPFANRPKAQVVAEKVRKNFKLDTWLTQ
jgi:cell division septation protein DedD